ncbi:T6SS immunity protein Tli4 family protein [Herbaspirillum sp. DW155]|uniref:T6SS immunity protein Tli4 family protein n=1 Tax=Herbaspirillum sp. DW155 TaxID=3095609 RepID=UPI00308B3596|nr:T6SS immunity protein Tli4 family protein [Herbaspirillum sp. DW155]
MNAITEKMITRCFGRYLIDLPESFILNTEGGQEIDGVTIDIKARSEAEFHQALETRKRVLESETLLREPNTATLKEILPLPNARGVIFDRAENEFSNMFRTLELMDWRDGYQIKMQIAARDMSYSKEENPNGPIPTTTPEKMAALLKVYHRTRPRGNEIPTGQGTCILNGFVAGPASSEESIRFFYHLNEVDDVYFTLATLSGPRDNDTLLDRMKFLAPIWKAGEGRLIRSGRIFHELPGQEVLYMTPDEHTKIPSMEFRYEDTRRGDGVTNPSIDVEMNVGKRKPEPDPKNRDEHAYPPPILTPSLSEAEAVYLWDKVIPTLRTRPGAF